MIRESPIAGSWYRGEKDQLINQIENLYRDEKFGLGSLPKKGNSSDETLLGIISPHAGYRYSGYTAAHAYGEIARSRSAIGTVVILGPNHQGTGPPLSISDADGWKTPLGVLEIDQKLRQQIIDTQSEFGIDIEIEDQAHLQEHSIEIQLPMLQYLYPDTSFVPICMKDQSLHTAKKLGSLLARLSKTNDILVVASTDLSHEYDLNTVKKNDSTIIDTIENLADTEEFDNKRQEIGITMCGYGPVSTLLSYGQTVQAFSQNSPSIEILHYSNSAQITGKRTGYSVGYLAAALYRS